jgi:tetratricopeptide (TPR) repeat protein
MNVKRGKKFLGAALILALVAGCGSGHKEPTEKELKEAALYASEGQFALSIKEWPRAEGLFLKATQTAPEGDYFLSLGVARLRLGKRSDAKAAYELAVRAFARDAARQPTLVDPWLRQAYALALLGRTDESRALLAKAAKNFPNDARVRALVDPKGFEQMIAAPNFKEMAL